MIRNAAIAIVLLALAGCETTNGTGAGDPAGGIAASTAQFEAAYNAGDAAGVAALYTEDGAVLPPDAPRIDGREGIQAMWQGFIDAGVTALDLATVELSAAGDAASEVGTYALQVPDGKGGKTTLTGKYIVLWQRGADGVWRLRRDIWNGDPAG